MSDERLARPVEAMVLVKRSGWDGEQACSGVRTHAPGCRWARSRAGEYLEVPAWRIPPETGRCQHCGGGRPF